MFRNQRKFETLVNDFEVALRRDPILDVGWLWGPSYPAIHKCLDLWKDRLDRCPVRLWDGELFTVLPSLIEEDDPAFERHHYAPIFGRVLDGETFLTNANRAGEFLVEEKMVTVYPALLKRAFLGINYYPMLVAKMFDFCSFPMSPIDKVKLGECDFDVFQNANQTAIETLKRLNDLPSQSDQGIPDDGPHEGYVFVWNQVSVALAPATWNVVNLLYQKENWRADIEEVLDVVFGGTSEHNFDSGDNKIRAVQKHARIRFMEKNVPLQLVRRGGYVQLIKNAAKN